jgi:hypothetical protein
MRREPHVRFCERAVVKFRRATHLVILSRGHAIEALAWTKAVMTKLGLASPSLAIHLAGHPSMRF